MYCTEYSKLSTKNIALTKMTTVAKEMTKPRSQILPSNVQYDKTELEDL